MQKMVNGFSMAYDEAGSGPAVVLIHGYPLCRQMWRPQLEALAAAGFRVIAPDLRGFGESDATGEDWSMATFADDVIGLMDALGIEQAVVGGMSMGGYVLLNLLERYPQRLAGACFIATRAGADDAAGREKRTALAAEVRAGRPQAVPEAFVGLLFASGTAKNRTELVREVKGWMDGTSRQGLAEGLLAIRDRRDYLDELERFELPSLVIGAEEDRAIPPEHSRAIQKGLPNASGCYIPAAGHMVNLEQPEAFNGGLLTFLRHLAW